ncbi:MAG: hypothetical protein LBO66_09785 [Deltaproteobacteria bacterium]|jgi:hypothetical protein|nr:hypothetical protein [Deltaproteobacteria bacterium]
MSAFSDSPTSLNDGKPRLYFSILIESISQPEAGEPQPLERGSFPFSPADRVYRLTLSPGAMDRTPRRLEPPQCRFFPFPRPRARDAP